MAWKRQFQFRAFRRDLELIGYILRQFDQIQWLFLENHLACLGLREQQQRSNNGGQAFDIRQRIDDCLAVLLRRLRGEQCHFELPTNNRYRRSQLMRNVG